MNAIEVIRYLYPVLERELHSYYDTLPFVENKRDLSQLTLISV